MAWTSGFFNSLNGDRMYNADQMSDMFKGLITNGVYESIGKKLAVEPNENMTIQINTGRGWFGGRWVNNDSPFLYTLEESDVVLNRYCAVCIRVDLTESGRTAEPVFKYSELATEPIKPTMERTEKVQEYCLAYVYIKAQATEITAADIEDTRFSTDLCGWVTGLIEQVDTDTLWTQWDALFKNMLNDCDNQLTQFLDSNTAEVTEFVDSNTTKFNNWFNSLEDLLTENAEANLTNEILQLQEDVENIHVKHTGVFDGLGWSSTDTEYYTQTVTVKGISANDYIMILPTPEFKEAYISMGCEAIQQADNSITFRCTKPDDINMAIEVIVIDI